MTEILICGKTEIFTEEALLKLAEGCRVVVAGKAVQRKKQKNIIIYKISVMEEQFRQLFDVYSFQTVFYVSGYADGGEGSFGELQQLERVMTVCRDFQVNKLTVLSSTDSCNYFIDHAEKGDILKKSYYSNRTFGAGQLEEACSFYGDRLGVSTVVLQTPYLADRINEHNFLGSIYQKLYEKQKILFPYHRDTPVDFLSLSDLTELMLEITEETEDEGGVYSAVSGYNYTYGDLEDMIRLAAPDAEILYEKYPYLAEIPDYPSGLRKKYGFIPMDNVMENIGAYYRTFLREVVKRRKGLAGKLSGLLAKTGKGVLKYAELVLVFIIAEFISKYTSDSIYFKFVDIRLFFILIMGTVYGMRTGLVAAVLECLVLIREYMHMGMSGTILFYNIENWIPFIVYLMAGSITGYISDKKDNALIFLKREYSLLRDKYLFLNEVYQGAIENKGEFKKQILGFKDSFGKIFDAVQKLNSELPERIFYEGLKVLEDILENHAIAIYTMDASQQFGRLAVCSNSLLTALTKSVRISDHQQVYDVATKKRVWKNSEMIPGQPMYACGIFRDETMVLMVTIWEAEVEQYGMHYMNIFQIMCGLVQTSFLRAMEYEEMTASQRYYPDTHTVYPQRLRQALDIQKAMKEEGIADYVLIRFEDGDLKRLEERLTGMVRANDMLGMDEKGNIYLLLVQMNRKNFHIVGNRLESLGIAYQIVEDIT